MKYFLSLNKQTVLYGCVNLGTYFLDRIIRISNDLCLSLPSAWIKVTMVSVVNFSSEGIRCITPVPTGHKNYPLFKHVYKNLSLDRA
jgi:hypothetical protein